MDNKKKTLCTVVLIAALSGAQALAQSGAAQDGIKVHGDWTLTVRNPDGTVAARHEFKNALAISLGGDSLLAQLLSGGAVAGQWSVELYPVPIAACHSNNSPCRITENSSIPGGTSRDLTKTVPTSGPDAGKLVLRGSVRIPINATINQVVTTLSTCAPTVSPASCVSQSNEAVTLRSLTPGVPVGQEQLVEVKVVISFS
jgi:hypothetical protein